MTKPIPRAMAVACLISRAIVPFFCTICKIELTPEDEIQFDHVHADKLGGEHHYSNLRPVHAECHRKKSKRDVKDLAKIRHIRGENKPKPKKSWPQGKKIPSSHFVNRPF